MKIFGREFEKVTLNHILKSDKPEFLAIYGRRRIGKTFLIRQFYKEKNVVFFNATGAKDAPLSEQIKHFTKQISSVFLQGLELKPEKTWDETFERLTKAFIHAPKDKKIVLFFDELPWMATRKSRLLQTLDYYWNQFWSDNPKIKLIICGSAASWIIQKIIRNKGGLYNRITEKIRLEPFTLKETKQFLSSLGVKLNNKHILFIYMVTGGVPYYLSKIKKNQTAAQIIEELAFTKNALMLDEFDDLFSSLFDDGEMYTKMIRKIAENRYGIGKRKLLEAVGLAAIGSGGVKKLRELEEAGFIISFKPLYHEKKGVFYRITDEYTLFYLKWIEPIRESINKQMLEFGYWHAIQNTPEWYNWLGYAFESVCYKHITAIKKALMIDSSARVSAWRYVPTKESKQRGTQIDLLFDRQDDAITICEIKYSDQPYILTKDYVDILQRKIKVFKERTKTEKQIFLVFVSANGIKNNYYADEIINGLVKLDDLFI